MPAFTLISSILLILASIAIIVVVLFQEGHNQQSGVVSGGADSFLSKGAARTMDKFLAKWTKVIAIGFFILTIVCVISAL